VSWRPNPTVTIDGVDYTGQTINRVSVSRGRRTVYERPNAGYASVEFRDVGDLPTLRVGRQLQISIEDSSGTPVTVFTGLLSDWSLQTVATGGEPVVLYRVQAVGPLALLNRRTVLSGGSPAENDGKRVLAAVRGADITWEEVALNLAWEDAVGSWETFGPVDTSLIEDGVFDLVALAASDSGYNALQVAQDAGFSGEGILFESADGRIGYANADRRFANEQAGFLEIPAALLDVRGVTLAQQLADITNRVTVEYATGVVSAEDPFSITEFGVYESSFGTLLVNESNAQARADEFVARHATPGSVLDELPVNLLSVGSALRDALLAVNTNDAIEVSGIPGRVGLTRFQGFVEGLSFSADTFAAELRLTVSDKSLSVGSVRWGQVPDTIAWQDVNVALEWQDAISVTV
jgi:hypothetical protein